MTELLTIKDVANLMGVTAKTIRRREKEGKIQSIRTPGGHRRFDKEELLKLMEKETLTVAYLRVNSDKQQEQLQKQLTILEAYRNRTNYNWEIIQDIGNGTNYHNQGLRRLLNLLCNECLQRLVVFHKSSLSRLGSDIIFHLCEIFKVEIVILNNFEGIDSELELQQDVEQIYEQLTYQFNTIQHQHNQEVKQQLQKIIVNVR